MVNRLVTTALAAACLILAVALYFHDARRPVMKAASMDLPPSDSSSADAQASLDAPLARVDLENVALQDAIISLADMSNVNICAEWQTLEDAGITRTARVRVHLKNVVLGQALDAMLKSLAQHDQFPACYVDRGIVIVSTAASGSQHTVTEYINIRALVTDLREYYESLVTRANKGSRSAPADDEAPRAMELIEMVVRLITDLVAADSWRDSGGTVGSIREVGGVLIITQTSENIQATHLLLDRLHQAIGRKDFTPAAPGVLATRSVSPANPSTQPVTECFNIRPLIAELQSGPGIRRSNSDDRSPLAPADVVDGISKLLFENIQPDSWCEKGGSIGKINSLGGILIITQTPADLEAARRLLGMLYRAAAETPQNSRADRLALEKYQQEVAGSRSLPATRPGQ